MSDLKIQPHRKTFLPCVFCFRMQCSNLLAPLKFTLHKFFCGFRICRYLHFPILIKIFNRRVCRFAYYWFHPKTANFNFLVYSLISLTSLIKQSQATKIPKRTSSAGPYIEMKYYNRPAHFSRSLGSHET